MECGTTEPTYSANKQQNAKEKEAHTHMEEKTKLMVKDIQRNRKASKNKFAYNASYAGKGGKGKGKNNGWGSPYWSHKGASDPPTTQAPKPYVREKVL